MTGFNLDEENEEGHFDEAGNYIRHKDDDKAGDAWLEGAAVYSGPVRPAGGGPLF